MQIYLKPTLAVAGFFLVFACRAPAILTPSDTADFPCGYHGIACGGGMCCDEAEVCGGDEPTCPPGQCCYVGELAGSSRGLDPRMHPQRPRRK